MASLFVQMKVQTCRSYRRYSYNQQSSELICHWSKTPTLEASSQNTSVIVRLVHHTAAYS